MDEDGAPAGPALPESTFFRFASGSSSAEGGLVVAPDEDPMADGSEDPPEPPDPLPEGPSDDDRDEGGSGFASAT